MWVRHKLAFWLLLIRRQTWYTVINIIYTHYTNQRSPIAIGPNMARRRRSENDFCRTRCSKHFFEGLETSHICMQRSPPFQSVWKLLRNFVEDHFTRTGWLKWSYGVPLNKHGRAGESRGKLTTRTLGGVIVELTGKSWAIGKICFRISCPARCRRGSRERSIPCRNRPAHRCSTLQTTSRWKLSSW